MIGEKLESLANQMPSDWWEIPMNILNERTKEASIQFERIMCQIWHFELATLVHLPFMLRAATDRRYEYSHVSCLNASRSLIKRWVTIRASRTSLLFSNLLEFQAFTAAVTLLLGLLGAPKSTNQEILQEGYEDSQLVETVIDNFERFKQLDTMTIGTQSISVIRTLQRFVQGGNASDKLRLEIPFFGVIRISRSGALQPLEGERVLGANGCQSSSFLRPAQSTLPSFMTRIERIPNLMPQPNKQIPHEAVGKEESYAGSDVGRDDTILQFSGGHFQLPEASGIQDGFDTSEWSFQESDMIFFDSLVNTDLMGDWTL